MKKHYNIPLFILNIFLFFDQWCTFLFCHHFRLNVANIFIQKFIIRLKQHRRKRFSSFFVRFRSRKHLVLPFWGKDTEFIV